MNFKDIPEAVRSGRLSLDEALEALISATVALGQNKPEVKS